MKKDSQDTLKTILELAAIVFAIWLVWFVIKTDTVDLASETDYQAVYTNTIKAEAHAKSCEDSFRADFKEYADRPIKQFPNNGYTVYLVPNQDSFCSIYVCTTIKGWTKENTYIPDEIRCDGEYGKLVTFYLKELPNATTTSSE